MSEAISSAQRLLERRRRRHAIGVSMPEASASDFYARALPGDLLISLSPPGRQLPSLPVARAASRVVGVNSRRSGSTCVAQVASAVSSRRRPVDGEIFANESFPAGAIRGQRSKAAGSSVILLPLASSMSKRAFPHEYRAIALAYVAVRARAARGG